MNVVVPLAVALLCALASCKRSSKTDLSSPEKAIESFFKALGEERIPDELNAFVIDEAERAMWRMRCKTRGCQKGTYTITGVSERGENGAVLIVDYEVFGKKGRSVMRDLAAPIRFERQGGNWAITQFGHRLTARSPRGTTSAIPPALDAGADSGGSVAH